MNTMDKTSIDYIKNLLLTNDQAVGRAMVALYMRQTVDEQRTSTTNVQNGKGFSAYHAKFGTYYAKWVQSGKMLTGKHLDRARKMSLHYVKQLSHIAAENVAAKATAHIAPSRKVIPQKVEKCEVKMTGIPSTTFSDLGSAILLTDPFQLQ